MEALWEWASGMNLGVIFIEGMLEVEVVSGGRCSSKLSSGGRGPLSASPLLWAWDFIPGTMCYLSWSFDTISRYTVPVIIPPPVFPLMKNAECMNAPQCLVAGEDADGKPSKLESRTFPYLRA